jgi:probable rRNA maturation factor
MVAAASAGIENGHLAIEFVGPERIAELNVEHRGKPGPTDVLSFPIDGVAVQGTGIDGVGIDDAGIDGLGIDELGIDGVGADGGGSQAVPLELGDVVICPHHTADLSEAIVHGVLHLVGMDHESDGGEMLALQAEILRWERDAEQH